MTITLGIALFFVIWWIILFAVLPFGVYTQAEDGHVVPGTPESAPKKFSFARVAQINTVVAIVLFCIVWAAIDFDVFGVGKFAAAVNR